MRSLAVVFRRAPRAGFLLLGPAAAVALLLPVSAAAFGLGAPRLSSGLGQPLDLAIPAMLGEGEADELAPRCLRLLPAANSDTPTLNSGSVQLERDGALTLIRIHSREAINEPALRVVLEAGCQHRIQREYVLLLDPPAGSQSFQAAASSAPPRSAATATAPVAGFDLGPAEIVAVRGRPLRIRAPVVGPEAPHLAADCVRTLDDGAQPTPLAGAQARLSGVGSAAPVLEIVSTEALAARSLRVIAEVGCQTRIRREFDVLVEAAPVTYENETATPRRAARPAASRRAATAALPPAAAAAAAVPAPRTAPGDRLLLATADETAPTVPAPAAPQTDALVQQLAALGAEMKRLRAELDTANARNAALAEKLARDDRLNIGWAVAAAVSLLFALLLWLSGRRGLAQAPVASTSAGAGEGPLSRLMGRQGAGASLLDAQAAPDLHAPIATAVNPDIQVTEMGDEEAIRELYAEFIAKQRGLPTQLGGGTRLGDDAATRVTVPLTTQIVVDIDLSDDVPAELQGAELQGEPAAAQVPAGSPSTMPPLDLDLELDLPTQAPPAGVRPA